MVFGRFAFSAVVACPTLVDLGGKRATADNDVGAGLDGLGLAVLVVAGGNGAKRATAEQDAGCAVDALAAVAAAGHGERAAGHGEVVVALDAGGAAVVVYIVVVDAVACGFNGGCAAGNDHDAVALDAAGSIGRDADVDGAVVNPQSVVYLDAVASGGCGLNGDVVVDDDVVVAGYGVTAVAGNRESARAEDDDLSLAEQGALLVVGLLGVRRAVGQGVGGAAGHMQVEGLSALVVDGGSVGVVQRQSVELYAELHLPINEQRTVGAGTAEYEQQRIGGRAGVHHDVGSTGGHETVVVAGDRGAGAVIGDIDDMDGRGRGRSIDVGAEVGIVVLAPNRQGCCQEE